RDGPRGDGASDRPGEVEGGDDGQLVAATVGAAERRLADELAKRNGPATQVREAVEGDARRDDVRLPVHGEKARHEDAASRPRSVAERKLLRVAAVELEQGTRRHGMARGARVLTEGELGVRDPQVAKGSGQGFGREDLADARGR